MRIFCFGVVLVMSSVALCFGNEFITELAGFSIGQYRAVVKNELGDPVKTDKYSDGFEYEIYLIDPDTSLYMIFEYSPVDLEIVWSIQLTGKAYHTDFKDLHLGADESLVRKALGVPSKRVDIHEYGQKWQYDGRNYSVEISTKGKLSSIKITDDSDQFFPKATVSAIPSYEQVAAALNSNDRSTVKAVLCPDVEVYRGDSTYYFRNRMSQEMMHDQSGVFGLISQLSGELKNIDTNNSKEYEENVRLKLGADPMHVIKIKHGEVVKEIVFKYRFGQYLIWEIRF
jgi:hypothetical protein